MSLLGLFDIGKSAMFASQRALTVISNNIANANTPGYSRQDVILEIAVPANGPGGQIGRGVVVAGIRRSYDRFIQSQLLGQYQSYGRSLALDQALGQVEQIFNDPMGAGLSVPLMEFFNAWHDVATNPEGATERYTLLQKAGGLVTAAKRMERGLLDAIRQIDDETEEITGRINDMASEIASLNQRIVQIEAGSGNGQAADLRDSRDQLLNELAKLTDFSSYEDTNGAVHVSIGMRSLVHGSGVNTLSTTVNRLGRKEIVLDNINITSELHAGRLGGLLDVRTEIEEGPLTGLRKLMASITQQVNLIHRTGFGLDGSTGNDFFSPLGVATSDYSAGADISASISDLSQVTLDEYTITFDAGGSYYVKDQAGTTLSSGAYVSGNPVTVGGITMVITGAVTAADSFTVSPLRGAISNMSVQVTDPMTVAASSSALELPGNNINALGITGLADTAVSNLGGVRFSEFYQGIVSDAGGMKAASRDSLRFDENMLSELESRRESFSGVSLDEEAANLIRYQRAFEAGARMIKTADELIQTVLSL